MDIDSNIFQFLTGGASESKTVQRDYNTEGLDRTTEEVHQHFVQTIRRTSSESITEVLNSYKYSEEEKQLYLVGTIGKVFSENNFLRSVFRGIWDKEARFYNDPLRITIINNPSKSTFFSENGQIYINTSNIIF